MSHTTHIAEVAKIEVNQEGCPLVAVTGSRSILVEGVIGSEKLQIGRLACFVGSALGCGHLQAVRVSTLRKGDLWQIYTMLNTVSCHA